MRVKVIIPDLTWRGDLDDLPVVERPAKIVIHHSAHPTWTIYDVHAYHRDQRGWKGIGYHYFIHQDGTVYRGRGIRQGAHVSGRNHDTLGICLQGDFEQQHPTERQLQAAALLVADLLDRYALSQTDVIGHRDLAPTACPGRNVDLGRFRARLKAILGGGDGEAGPYPDVPAGHWAAASIGLVKQRGLMGGYPDGTFKPDQPVTRAELASVVARILGRIGDG